MATKEIDLLLLREAFNTDETNRHIFDISTEVMNNYIVTAAKESNFSRWLNKWDSLYTNRTSIISKSLLNSNNPSTYCILHFFHCTPSQVLLHCQENQSFALLRNSNDLSEIEDFIYCRYEFVKRLCEYIYGNPVVHGLQNRQLLYARELKSLEQLFSKNGLKWHLAYAKREKKILLDNGVTLWLKSDEEDNKHFFSFQRNPQDSIIVNINNLKDNIKTNGDSLLQAIYSKSLSNIYTDTVEAVLEFDPISYDYQVDLSWNYHTRQMFFPKNDYIIYRSYDGYIATADNCCYFRPTWEELSDAIEFAKP